MGGEIAVIPMLGLVWIVVVVVGIWIYDRRRQERLMWEARIRAAVEEAITQMAARHAALTPPVSPPPEPVEAATPVESRASAQRARRTTRGNQNTAANTANAAGMVRQLNRNSQPCCSSIPTSGAAPSLIHGFADIVRWELLFEFFLILKRIMPLRIRH